MNTCTVIDYPVGANNYTYVIKLLLGPLYNNREILLCFDKKSDQQNWLKSFNTNTTSPPGLDSFDLKLEEERKEKELRLSSSDSVDEEYDEFKKQGEGYHQYVNTRTSYRYSNIDNQWNEETD